MMIAALSILVLVIMLFAFVIFTSIVLKIDTNSNQYYIEMRGIAKCSLLVEESLMLEVKTFFYKFTIDPFQSKKDKKDKVIKSKEKSNKISNENMKKANRLVKSFTIKQLYIDLDTSDVIWNSYLYPIFFALNLNSEHTHLNINYCGEVTLFVHMENRLSKMAWALIR